MSINDQITLTISKAKLLTPEAEQKLAKSIKATQLKLWMALLASGPISRHCALRGGAKTRALIASGVELDKIARRLIRQDKNGNRLAELREIFPAAFKPAKIAQLWRNYNNLRNSMVHSNMRLVITQAKRYGYSNLPINDLIQEGLIGLMKAVHRFEPERGFRFSTYAHWWIRQHIERAITNKGEIVRKPVHFADIRRRTLKMAHRLERQLQREPTTEELAAATGYDEAIIRFATSKAIMEPVSLDDSLTEDNPHTIGEMLMAPQEEEHDFSEILGILDLLQPNERDIIKRRFGIGTDAEQTLEEIGHAYGTSRERIRQIEAAAIVKLKLLASKNHG